MKQLIALLALIVLARAVSAQSPPTINVCSGDQTICLKATTHKVCVKITVEAGLPAIDHFTIDWGDGTALTTVPGSNNPAQQEHTYDLSAFYNKCDFEEKFTVELLTYFAAEPNNPKNNSFVLRFHNPPIPDFNYSGKLCANEPIQFSDKSCTNALGTSAVYFWDFGNGQTSTLSSPITSYPSPGGYTVKLCVKNDCDSVCITKGIFILDKPQVNTVSFTATPLSGCFPLEIKAQAAVKEVFDYDWSVIPLIPCTGCYQFVPAGGKDSIAPVIRFTKEGVYQVLLTGKNQCGEDTMSVWVNVFAPPQVNLTGTPVGCKNFLYTPQVEYLNVNPSSITSYKWTFPKGVPMMSTLKNPTDIQYVNNSDTLLSDLVTLTVDGPCGLKTFSIPVKVYGDTDVKFAPLGPVCRSLDAFKIPVTPAPPAGVFTSNLPAPAFDPVTGILYPSSVAAGIYNLTYTVEIVGATNCTSQKSTTIEIRDSTPIAITTPTRLCIDAAALTLQANPAGGVWKSKGSLDSLSGDYSAAKAQAGNDMVSYVYENPITHCLSEVVKNIEIVALPLINHDSILYACQTGQEIDLETEGHFLFTPAGPGPQKSWSGTGVTSATGKFLANSIGLFNCSVTYTIDPQCAAQRPFKIQVDSFIAAAASPPVTLCKNQDTYMLIGTPAGGIWSDGPNIDPTTGKIDLTLTQPGTYHYKYTIRENTLCESSATVQVIVVPGDGVSVAKTEDYVCETTGSYTLPNASPSGSWSGPELNGNAVNVSKLSPDTFVYVYTATNLPDACNKVSFTLIVAPKPSADFSIDPDTACIGNQVTLHPVASGLNYAVNWGDNTTNSLLSHPYTQEGDFLVSLTVSTLHPLLSNTVLCSNQAIQSVHIVAPPQKLAFGMVKDTTGCAVLQVTFTNLSIAENGRFLWDFGNGQPPFEGFQPSSAIAYEQGIEDTSYVVRLTVLTGCDSLVFKDTVTVFPLPRAGFGLTYNEPCSGGILQLNNTSTGNPAQNRWLISDPALEFNTFNPPPLQFFTGSLPRSVNIALITSNQCGVDTAWRTITVNPTDVTALINISDTTRVCVGDTVILTSFSTPGAPTRWKTAQGNTFLENPIQLTFGKPGLYKITLYAEGCGFDSMDVWVRVQPLPTVTVEHPPLLCPGDTAAFKAQTSAPGFYLYFGDGDSTKLKTTQHRYPQSGSYALQAVATSLAGCRNVWNGSLEVAAKPEALVQTPDSACSGLAIPFLSLSANGLNCLWNFGDGITDDGCTLLHRYAQGGLYTVALTVVSALGCRDTVLAPLYVRNTPSALPSYQILEPCSPALVRFNSQSLGATSLDWSLGDGNTAQLVTFEHTYGLGGQYLVQLIATNEGICSDTGKVTVKLFQTPLFDFNIRENCTVAAGTDLRIQTPIGNRPTVTGPGYQRDGDLHPGLLEGFYEVNIVSPEGCQSDTTIFVPKPAELLLYVAEDSFDLALGQSAALDAVVNKQAVRFQWMPGDWLSGDTIAQPLAIPFRTIQYIVRATDGNGCFKTDTVFIKVRIDRDSGLYIPDIFTPNDDGVNDIFYVRSVNPALDKIEQFRILDKYGEIMFDLPDSVPEQEAFGWEGDFKGKKAEAGLYRYQVVLVYTDGERVVKTGYIMLAR